jgi:hypothetical protein
VLVEIFHMQDRGLAKSINAGAIYRHKFQVTLCSMYGGVSLTFMEPLCHPGPGWRSTEPVGNRLWRTTPLCMGPEVPERDGGDRGIRLSLSSGPP